MQYYQPLSSITELFLCLRRTGTKLAIPKRLAPTSRAVILNNRVQLSKDLRVYFLPDKWKCWGEFQINRIVIRNDQNQDLIWYLQQSLLTFTYQWMQAGFMLLVSALTEGI